MIMFGPFKDKKLSEVPDSYLKWLLEDYKGSSLSKEDIEKEAASRGLTNINNKWGRLRMIRVWRKRDESN